MSFIGEAVGNVRIAWRMACFDPDGADRFGDDSRAFWRSFWVLPLVLVLDRTVTGLTSSAFAEADASLGRSSLATGWLIVGWLLALNIAAEFARHMGRAERWPRFVVAHNWAALIQGGAFAAGVVVLSAMGASADLYGFWVVVVGFWSLVYDWFVVKTALKVDGPPAALLIGILLFAALMVNQVASGFAAG